MTKPSCVHPATRLARERSSLALLDLSTQVLPSMEPEENPLIGLGRCEQKTVYQGPGSVWKQRVNYKQQGLSTICSTLNDVILTLKLPETHLLRAVLCSMNYPLRFGRASNPCLFAQPFHFLSTGAAASSCQSRFPKATILEDHGC